MNKYLSTLELEEGATKQDIKTAYRDLQKVWHPDRFVHDPKLQAKAEEKIKLINLAYEKLTNYRQKVETKQETVSAQPELDIEDFRELFVNYQPKQKSFDFASFGWAAASILLIIAVAGYLYYFQMPDQPRKTYSRR